MEKIDEIMQDFIKDLDCDYATLMFSKIKSGKKLRSKLILNIAEISDESLRLCAIIELIQIASLLHDDVIDDAKIRRGIPSINVQFGVKDAIILGDILYAKAFFELSKFDNFIAKTISNSVYELSIGELLDVNLSKSLNLDEKKYLNMIYKKTAVFIEACAVSAAFLAKLPTQDFANYGKNLGIAFQLIDDILDITQDSKTLGKPNLHDFKEGKTTLPYIKLFEKLSKNDQQILKNLFKKELNDCEISWIKEKMQEFGIIEICLKEAKIYANLALKSIENYKNKNLENVITSMIDREF